MDTKTRKHPRKERSVKLRLSRETLKRLEDEQLREVGGGATGRTCPIVSWCYC